MPPPPPPRFLARFVQNFGTYGSARPSSGGAQPNQTDDERLNPLMSSSPGYVVGEHYVSSVCAP